MRWRKMKNHEYRELVNTLTKIAREYGQTQQLRERIAHALPFDCDVIDGLFASRAGTEKPVKIPANNQQSQQ